MLRENIFPIHLGSYIAGLFTAVLVVIVGWSLSQTVPIRTPVTFSSGDGDVSISGTSSAVIHPADRKLVDKGHIAILMDRSDRSLANVDPADRKFFGGAYEAYGKAVQPRQFALAGESDRWPANVDPADRKFFDGAYEAYGKAVQPRQSALAGESDRWPANLDPADRKFYEGTYKE
ncbi:MAG: hypothetical protein GWP61_03060 [Chloroflexi bacterium]|jgi:hypothetical protein|nr:hypothetical protein [Chloroflexota bacterium]